MGELIILSLILSLSDQFQIKCDLEFEADGVTALHYDEDQCCELIVNRDNRYYVTDQKLISRFQLNFSSKNGYLACQDIDGVAGNELLYQGFESGTLFVEAFSSGKDCIRYNILHGLPAAWDGMLSACKASDLNNDGKKELICLVGSNYDLQPRGLLVYDRGRDCELWHFWMGASPRDLHVADIDGDNKKEIIISTTAVANGSVLNGFDDSNAYVICFNANGTVKWSRIIGSTFTDAITWVGDIDDDREIEIVVVEAEGTADRHEPNRIHILNAKNGTTKKYIAAGGKYMGLIICDLDRNEKKEIIVGNVDGNLRVYDSNLECIMERGFDGRLDVITATDLNGDGYLELLATMNTNRLLVLNEKLESVGEYSSDDKKPIRLSCIQHDRKNRLLVNYGDEPPYSYRLLSFGRPIINPTDIYKQPLIFYAILLMLVLIITFLIVRNNSLMRRLSRQQLEQSRIFEWSGFAQRLAHEIKNPLSTINLILQRIQDIGAGKYGEKDPLKKYTLSALEEVERLRETTNKFMRVLSLDRPQFGPNDMNSLIDEALKRYIETLPASIRITKDYGKDLPLVHCDREQMITAFSNLFENAIDALNGKGMMSARSILCEKMVDRAINQYIEVKIEDNGSGICPRLLPQLFKPFISTKESGTGLGLVIAKIIVNQHHGEIEIDSKEKIGTVVTIRLPVKGDRRV